MSRLFLSLLLPMLVLPAGARAQAFQDALVQPPQLAAPQRGSLVGQYARTAFGPADVSRGGFSLSSPFAVPTERGPLLASPFPTYSPDSGISEWGLGWQVTLALTRSRVIGDLDYQSDELTGPWGRMVQGHDGAWYPLGLKGLVRVVASGDALVAHLPDGSRWTFGGTARVQTLDGTHAWHLTRVETVTGRTQHLTYTANDSGRLFLQSVAYGGEGADARYRVDFSYAPLSTPFWDYRSGAPLRLDRRVSQVDVLARDAHSGLFVPRWHYTVGYVEEGLGPAFFLSSVRQVFASGEAAPPVTYEYAMAADALRAAALRPIPKFDPVMRDYSEGIALPDQSTSLDANEDGLVDLESGADFTLIRQHATGYTYEPLPAAAPDARPECRPSPSAMNAPRTLAQMRAGDPSHQVVSLFYSEALAGTEVLWCERDGGLLQQQFIPEYWTLGPNSRLVDLNRDRQPDLVHVYAGGYRVLPNSSSASGYAFGAPLTGDLLLFVEPEATWVNDFNGDSLPDLVVRHDSSLFVFAGTGRFRFEQVGWPLEARLRDGTPLPLSGFNLSFVDANKDGLMDVLASSVDGALLLVNTGTQLVEQSVPGLEQLGWGMGLPVAQDFEGTGNAEVFFVKNGLAHSLALNAAGTGLLASADDGKGTLLRFIYARGPAVPGQHQRQTVLEYMKVASSGQEHVLYHYLYGEPRAHSVGGFFLGYEQVTREDTQVTREMRFLHEDRFVGVPRSSWTRDVHTPLVERFETHTYEDATFRGIAWMRPRETVGGWRGTDGSPGASERTEYLAYEADVCPSRVRLTHAHGTLVTEKTRASVSGLAQALHCLESRKVLIGTHADSTLNFRHEAWVERNAVGLTTRAHSVTPGHTLALQEVHYAPDFSIEEISSPGRGVIRFAYAPGSRLLTEVTAEDGVETRVTSRDPVTDAILSLEVDRGALLHAQSFRYDGQERLAKRWDNLSGSDSAPLETYSYRYATATTPASVFLSTRVDEGSGAVRDSIGLVTAGGDGVGNARRTPQGWVFDGVAQYTAVGSETRTWMRPTVSGTVDVRALDYAELVAGGQQVSFLRTSAFGHAVDRSTSFHADVEQRMAASLGLQAGVLTRTAWENGTWRTRTSLDAALRVVSFEDQAGTRQGYRYDALGRLREVALPDGSKHRVQYDGHGRISRLEREGVAHVEYVFDAVTGLTRSKRFLSPANVLERQVSFTYDGAGRLVTETYDDFVNSPQGYRYWRDGATPTQPSLRTALGLVTAVEGEGYLKRVEYRADGRVSRRVLQLLGWRIVEQDATYAASGDVASETVTVRDWSGAVLSSSVRAHRWDAYGRPAETWLNGQLLALFDYDANERLASAALSPGGLVTFGYEPLTRARVSMVQQGPGWKTSTNLRMNARGLVGSESFAVGGKNLQRQYGYSAQGFLTQASDADGAYAYDFDGFGLPTSITEEGVQRGFVTQGGTLTVGGTTYTFDSLGRTVSKGNLTFGYGPHGHMAIATRSPGPGASSAEWRFLYDENGQRLLKLVSGAPVAAYLEGGLYLDATGLTEPFRVGGQVVGLVKNGAFQMAATDLRGTVLADADGTARRVSPFGNRGVHPDVAAALDYVQKGYDADLGLIRMGVRDYDPAINRFLTPDPVFLEEPWRCVDSPVECNLYGYAAGNPVLYSDPTGQWIESALDAVSLAAGLYSISQWDEKTSTLDKVLDVGGVVLDGVALAVPLVPGGAGLGIKALRGGEKAVDAVQGMDKVVDASKMVGHSDEAAQLAGKADELGDTLKAAEECAGGKCVGPGGCFVAGTPVLTREGLKPIERVEAGEQVWSRDAATGESGWRRVARTFIRYDKPVLDVELRSDDGRTETVTATEEHPFWVVDHGWMEAKDLRPGLLVPSAHGGWLRVQRATWRQGTATVFNFEVEGFHTYFVGQLSAWVHNNDACLQVHSRYPDNTPVYEGQQPGKIQGPNPDANGAPHTQVQWDTTNNRVYKAREYGENGVPVRDIDFTGPTFPNGKPRPDHHVPEQHPWIPNVPGNPKAGFKRGPGEALVIPTP